MKLQILDDLVTEVALPVSADACTEYMEEFCLAGKVETLVDSSLRITIYQQKCTLDEGDMSEMFNEILYLFDYKLEFSVSADFDLEFCMSIRKVEV